MDQDERSCLMKGLKRHYKVDVLSGKGGFFVKGHGHITLPQARRITGCKAKPRCKRRMSGGYGDYATLRKIAGRIG